MISDKERDRIKSKQSYDLSSDLQVRCNEMAILSQRLLGGFDALADCCGNNESHARKMIRCITDLEQIVSAIVSAIEIAKCIYRDGTPPSLQPGDSSD